MPEYENHPSQKPLALLERIIMASSNANEIVLDPFAGTFTAACASGILGRKSVNIEINEDYLKTGLRRLGILEKYDGEELHQVKKTYQKRTTKCNISTRLFE